jgi:hypothetical protein
VSLGDIKKVFIQLPNKEKFCYVIGVSGVQAIWRDEYCPEPHCSISQIKIRQNDNVMTFNEAYIVYSKISYNIKELDK